MKLSLSLLALALPLGAFAQSAGAESAKATPLRTAHFKATIRQDVTPPNPTELVYKDVCTVEGRLPIFADPNRTQGLETADLIKDCAWTLKGQKINVRIQINGTEMDASQSADGNPIPAAKKFNVLLSAADAKTKTVFYLQTTTLSTQDLKTRNLGGSIEPYNNDRVKAMRQSLVLLAEFSVDEDQ